MTPSAAPESLTATTPARPTQQASPREAIFSGQSASDPAPHLVSESPVTSTSSTRIARTKELSQPLSIAILLLLLAGSILLALCVGAVHVPLRSVLRAMTGNPALSATDRLILLQVRLPRVLAGALVGSALSVSGLLFQGLFRNPMADPFVLGASGGSVLGAGLGLFLLGGSTLLGFSAAALLAFVGALVTMLLVYLLARRNGRTNPVTLLLAGFAIGTVFANSTSVFEVLDRSSVLGPQLLASWLHGVVSTPGWGQLGLSSAATAAALVACFPLTRRLNTLALGEEYAQQLGVNVEATRIGIIVLGALLTAIAVALGGLISFAGLIVPHVTRLLFGADNSRLLPLTALAGAAFLVLADTLARTLFAPSEIPVGILMAALGGPFFLYLLRRSRRSYAL